MKNKNKYHLDMIDNIFITSTTDAARKILSKVEQEAVEKKEKLNVLLYNEYSDILKVAYSTYSVHESCKKIYKYASEIESINDTLKQIIKYDIHIDAVKSEYDSLAYDLTAVTSMLNHAESNDHFTQWINLPVNFLMMLDDTFMLKKNHLSYLKSLVNVYISLPRYAIYTIYSSRYLASLYLFCVITPIIRNKIKHALGESNVGYFEKIVLKHDAFYTNYHFMSRINQLLLSFSKIQKNIPSSSYLEFTKEYFIRNQKHCYVLVDKCKCNTCAQVWKMNSDYGVGWSIEFLISFYIMNDTTAIMQYLQTLYDNLQILPNHTLDKILWFDDFPSLSLLNSNSNCISSLFKTTFSYYDDHLSKILLKDIFHFFFQFLSTVWIYQSKQYTLCFFYNLLSTSTENSSSNLLEDCCKKMFSHYYELPEVTSVSLCNCYLCRYNPQNTWIHLWDDTTRIPEICHNINHSLKTGILQLLEELFPLFSRKSSTMYSLVLSQMNTLIIKLYNYFVITEEHIIILNNHFLVYFLVYDLFRMSLALLSYNAFIDLYYPVGGGYFELVKTDNTYRPLLEKLISQPLNFQELLERAPLILELWKKKYCNIAINKSQCNNSFDYNLPLLFGKMSFKYFKKIVQTYLNIIFSKLGTDHFEDIHQLLISFDKSIFVILKIIAILKLDESESESKYSDVSRLQIFQVDFHSQIEGYLNQNQEYKEESIPQESISLINFLLNTLNENVQKFKKKINNISHHAGIWNTNGKTQNLLLETCVFLVILSQTLKSDPHDQVVYSNSIQPYLHHTKLLFRWAALQTDKKTILRKRYLNKILHKLDILIKNYLYDYSVYSLSFSLTNECDHYFDYLKEYEFNLPPIESHEKLFSNVTGMVWEKKNNLNPYWYPINPPNFVNRLILDVVTSILDFNLFFKYKIRLQIHTSIQNYLKFKFNKILMEYLYSNIVNKYCDQLVLLNSVCGFSTSNSSSKNKILQVMFDLFVIQESLYSIQSYTKIFGKICPKIQSTIKACRLDTVDTILFGVTELKNLATNYIDQNLNPLVLFSSLHDINQLNFNFCTNSKLDELQELKIQNVLPTLTSD